MRHRSYMDSTADQERELSGEIKVLASIRPFLKPYMAAMIGALVALLIAAATVLALGQGLRFLALFLSAMIPFIYSIKSLPTI